MVVEELTWCEALLTNYMAHGGSHPALEMVGIHLRNCRQAAQAWQRYAILVTDYDAAHMTMTVEATRSVEAAHRAGVTREVEVRRDGQDR
jgi:hypothetical protein